MDTRERLPSILDLIHLGRVLDADGRPLYESKAPADLQARAPARLAPYGFSDSPSRTASGRPVRVDAYEQVRTHLDEVLWTFQVLRDLHERASGEPIGALADVRRLCTMGQSVPRYLRAAAYFGRTPPRDPATLDEVRLPVPAAVLFKSIVGITSLIDHVLAQDPEAVICDSTSASGGTLQARSWTAEKLLAAAETGGLLVGPREACAAPSSMILRTLRTLLQGRGGEARPPSLAPILAEPERFVRFSAASTGATGEIRRFKELAAPLVDVARRELEAHAAPLLARAEFKRVARRIERYFRLEQDLLTALAERQAEMLALFDLDPRRAPRPGPADVDVRVLAGNPRALLAARHPFEARYRPPGVVLVPRDGTPYELEL
ncbi:MAG: hypothetical protein JNK02_01215 [Planctomycetes bacterium]|nr:hypothetical protein [Planctomycetota bacterium]